MSSDAWHDATWHYELVPHGTMENHHMGGVGEATQGPQASDTYHMHVCPPSCQMSQAKIFGAKYLERGVEQQLVESKK